MRGVLFRGAVGIYSQVREATGNSSRVVVCFSILGFVDGQISGGFVVLGLFVKKRVFGLDLIALFS